MGIVITTLLIAGFFTLATLIEGAVTFLPVKSKDLPTYKPEYPILAVQSRVHSKKALNFNIWHQMMHRERVKTSIKVAKA